MYKKDYACKMNLMEEIFEIRSWLYILEDLHPLEVRVC